MSNKDTLTNIKKLREITGVGFKDCKLAIDENNGDIEKSKEFLRKKGIAKASKKMSRTAAEGLALVKEVEGQISIIKPNVAHTMVFSKDTTFLNLVRGERNHENYGITHTIPYKFVDEEERDTLLQIY